MCLFYEEQCRVKTASSLIKNSGCPSSVTRFSSQHLCDSPQPSVNPVPRNRMPSSNSHMCQACMWYTDVHEDTALIHKNEKVKILKIS